MELSLEQFESLTKKSDLEQFSKKSDLEQFAKKSDLDATNERVDKLDQKVDKLSIMVLKNTADIEDIKENMATKDDINKILTAVDCIAKKFENHQDEHTANMAAHDRFEGRITRIERNLKLEPVVS